ncbi:MAG: hypothetical protein LBT51_09025 [Fusobacteriaceae bacterium]|nr:hypothetical protein [Fusobacteriaceae bacterium]
MAIPIIFGAIAAITAITGAAKGVKGVMDNSKANDVQERAEDLLNDAKRHFEQTKNQTKTTIEELGRIKISVCANELKKFVDNFSKIKNVEFTEINGIDKLNITKNTLQEMKDYSLSAMGLLGSGIAGIGGGALLGWGVYGGVMALGTASTGAAIGGLSGVAAANATLAWLGGGALAAGGGGMALGTAVLGGIVAGPALLIIGGIFGSKAEAKLNNAYSNLAAARAIKEQLKSGEIELEIITNVAKQLSVVIRKLSFLLDSSVEAMKNVIYYKTNWKEYSEDEKNTVTAAMKNAQLLKSIIDKPLLTKDGKLSNDFNSEEMKKVFNLGM